MSGQIIETIQNPETSDWEATFILIMGWLTCGLVLFLIFGRKDAERQRKRTELHQAHRLAWGAGHTAHGDMCRRR